MIRNSRFPDEFQFFTVVFNPAASPAIRQTGHLPIEEALLQGSHPGDRVLVLVFDPVANVPALADPVELMAEIMALREAHAENLARDDAVYGEAEAVNAEINARFDAMWADAQAENEARDAALDAAWAAAHAEAAVRELVTEGADD